MMHTKNVGKYQLNRTIGEGTFAKVKLAKNLTNGEMVAIKVIDKQMVVQNNFKYQVLREIRTMKLLNHPNIVRIHEVIGTKTKIYIVMEYVAGGQLSDKLCYQSKLSEKEARKFFHQLIDAIDYCHSKGVYHRDLKPENLLLDSRGNLKISDFGLSTLHKPGTLQMTACGSPCYVAPELLKNKQYDGAAADVWACGVIFFELLAGYLPFDDRNLLGLYRKICKAEYKCPQWFTTSHEKLLGKIFNPLPEKRIRIAEIIEDEWFQIDYNPAVEVNFEGKYSAIDSRTMFNSKEVTSEDEIVPHTSQFINAFELMAIANDLGLSGLFEEQDDSKRIMLGSRHAIDETIRIIEATAMDASLSVERMNGSNTKMQLKLRTKSKSCSNLLAEVTEVAPTDCLVKISKSAGTLAIYQEFCQSLSSVLAEETDDSLTRQRSMDDNNSRKEDETKERFAKDELKNRIKSIDFKSMLIKHSRHAGVEFLSSEGCCQHGENIDTHALDKVLISY